MKVFYFIPIIMLFLSCSEKKASAEKEEEQKIEEIAQEILVPAFQTIIDSAKLNGAILIYDLKDDKYYSNDFGWARKGKLPASTFKIPNSIIALETEVVENDSFLFKWNGEQRRFKFWERDLIFRDAFRASCLPCYREVARKVGLTRMKEQLAKLDYGNMKFDSTDIDIFWVEGASRINQFQQIDFLKRFYQSELPISKRTEAIVKNMMLLEEKETFKLSGKTGWSVSNENNNGWFVGYVETQDKTYFFATNVEPIPGFDMKRFPAIRKEITYEVLEMLKIIKY